MHPIHASSVKSAKSLLLALFMSAGLAAQAQVISWNYDVFGTIAPAEHAGVVDAFNWNNTWTIHNNTTGAAVLNSDLMDDSGAATTMDITQLSSQNSWNYWSVQGSTPGLDADGSSNLRLINGYNNKGDSEAPFLSRITLSEIPYAQYDLYVYFSADAAGRVGTVTDGATTYDFSTLGAGAMGANALLTQTTSIGGTNPGANYAIFTGLGGVSQTIDVSIAQWGGVAGIQVVAAVPEPAESAAIAGLGGLALLMFKRRNRRKLAQ